MYARPILLALWALVACTDVEPLPGQEGGACRVSLQPCDAPLVCTSGGCRQGTDDNDGRVGVVWSFPLMGGRDSVQADGVDSVVVQALLLDTETGEPKGENFGFRMWVEPPEAGTLTILRDFNPLSPDNRWSLISPDGRAVAQFVGCDKNAAGCVRYASVRIAVEPRPLAAIDQVIIENVGAPVPGGAGGAGGVGGEAGGGGAGGSSLEPLPPLGPCPRGVARVKLGGASVVDLPIQRATFNRAAPQLLGSQFNNDDIPAVVEVNLDTSGLGQDIGARTYLELGEGAANLFVRVSVGGQQTCSMFVPDRLSVEAYTLTQGVQAFAAQIGGICEEQGVAISACLNWVAP